MISNVVLHSLPAGYRFDLRRRHRIAAPGAARARRRGGRLQLTHGLARPRDADDASPGVPETAAAPTPAPANRAVARPRRRRRGRRPVPTGPQPTLRILETRVLRGPNYWAREPVVRMLVDLGIARGVPLQHDPRLHRRPDRAHAVARGPRLLARPPRRLPDPAARRDVGRPRRRAHRARAAEPRRHGRPPRQDALGRQARPVQRASTSSARSRSASRPARSPSRSSTTSSRRTTRRAPSTSRRARAAHPAGRAARVRAVDPGAHRRGGQPRHPVHPPRPPQPRPARPGRPPAAHPGDDDVADERHRRRHRLGQGPDQPAARLGRPARAALRRSSTRPTRRSRRAPSIGFPCVVKPLDGNHGRGVALDLRTEDGVRAAFERRSRESRAGDVVVETYVDRQRLPRARHRRARSPRSPSACPRRSPATASTRPRAGRDRERRPAPRHRPREGAHADQARRRGRGARPRRRASSSTRCRRRARGVKLALTGNMSTGGTSIDRTIEAHPDNVEIAETAARVVGLDIAGIDFIVPGHRASPCARPGGAHRRGQRRARLPDAHPPDRGRAAVRRAAGHRLCCSRRAPTRASRSSP